MKSNPDYNLCTDERKVVYFNICTHIIKRDKMLCNLHNNKPECIAWKNVSMERTDESSSN